MQYLGRSGKCKIEERERGKMDIYDLSWFYHTILGWYIQYIDQEEENRKKKLNEKTKREKDDEERMIELREQQIER